MNGIPVSLFQNLQNAPTWRPRNHFKKAYFRPNFNP